MQHHSEYEIVGAEKILRAHIQTDDRVQPLMLSEKEVTMLAIMFESKAWNKWQEIKDRAMLGTTKTVNCSGVATKDDLLKHSGSYVWEEVLDRIVDQVMVHNETIEDKKRAEAEAGSK